MIDSIPKKNSAFCLKTSYFMNKQGRPQDLAMGGGAKNFFSDLEICEAMRFASGVRGHVPPPRNFF